MSTPINDRMGNNLIATGGLFAIIAADDRAQVISVDRNTIMVKFPFLASPYRITIEIVPDEAASQ